MKRFEKTCKKKMSAKQLFFPFGVAAQDLKPKAGLTQPLLTSKYRTQTTDRERDTKPK
jgi:hypothetical protein